MDKRLIKTALQIVSRHPALIPYIFSGNSHVIYCKYWKMKIKNAQQNFRDSCVDLTGSELIEQIRQVNERILQSKFSTIEAYYIPLYVTVRCLKPDVVVETGVHRGVSSLFILTALDENQKGTLYSIDLPNARYAQDDQYMTESTLPVDKIGVCVPEKLRKRWHLILGDSKQELPTLLQNIKQIDLFIHDSMHTHDHMLWEYQTAWNYIRHNGVLISDNTDWGKDAFAEFGRQVNQRYEQIRRDGRTNEMFGIIVKENFNESSV